MDRGLVHESSPLVGEMGEGHEWRRRSLNNMRAPFEQSNPSIPLPSTSTSTCCSPINSFSSLLLSNHYPLPTTSTAPWLGSSGSNQGLQLQDPWSHLFVSPNGELANEDERYGTLEGQALFPATTTGDGEEGDASSAAGYMFSNTARHGSSPAGHEVQVQLAMSSPSPWSRSIQHHHNTLTLEQQASSPRSSSITSLGNNMLEFSNNASPRECINTGFKKARTQELSPSQSIVKVRKEKLGDRITALHQLVSPFGKTDTASVLLEAIGYIRFLHGQIEGLSGSPYQLELTSGNGGGGGSSSKHRHPHQATVSTLSQSLIFKFNAIARRVVRRAVQPTRRPALHRPAARTIPEVSSLPAARYLAARCMPHAAPGDHYIRSSRTTICAPSRAHHIAWLASIASFHTHDLPIVETQCCVPWSTTAKAISEYWHLRSTT